MENNPKKHEILRDLETRFGTKKPLFTFNTLNLGELTCFPTSVNDMIQFSNKLQKRIDESNSKEFARKLIMVCCYPSSKLDEDRKRPSNTLLTENDINNISESEIDIFCTEHLKYNEYLYRKLEFIEKLSKKTGEKVSTAEYGEIEHPKYDTESNTDYMFRLYLNKEKRDTERTKKLLGPLNFFCRNFKKD